MASYNELLALIDAYINQNGVQAITGQVLNGVLRAMVDQLGRGYAIMGAADPTTDPGTPDGPETWFASVPGTYTNFDGIQIVPGELALLSYVPSDGFSKNTIYEGFQTVQATIDGNVGTPAVGVSYANGILSFDFHNMKGNPGNDGAPAGFGTVNATVDDQVGTPSVSVSSSGPDTAKNFTFAFRNLKGETGVTSVLATVDNTSGNPQCAVSLNGQQLVLNFTGLKGAQGDTGSSVDYPFTIVNNLTTNDPAQALSAAMGVQLESEVSQLEAKVNNITVVSESSGDEESVEFQTDEGDFIAKVSPDGVEAKDVKARIEGQAVSLSGVYSDSSDTDTENLIIGDNNGKNIVEFSRGHVKTKYFDSADLTERVEDLTEQFEHLEPQESFPTLRKNAFLEDFYSYRYGKTANNLWFQRLRIMHFSDNHANIINLKESLGLAQGLVHLVVDTGDNANGGGTIPASATIAELQSYKSGEQEANNTPMPMVICNGNHDVPDLTKQEYYEIMCQIISSTNPSFVFGDSAHYRTYGYVDVAPNATIGTVRIISLDPFDYDDGQYNNPYLFQSSVFSQTQINWLISTLRDAVNNGYKVITTMHYSWGDNPAFTESGSANPDARYYQNPFMIPDIIDAIQNKVWHSIVCPH